MKALIMAVVMFAVVGLFSPSAYADVNMGDSATLSLNVTFDIQPEKVIAIELSEASWLLEGIKLGQVVKPSAGRYVKNTGNVPVKLDIGYVPIWSLPENKYVMPGLEPGQDTFSTSVGVASDIVYDANGNIISVQSNFVPIPPDERVFFGTVYPDGVIGFGNSFVGKCPLELIYMAPTELSEGIKGMDAGYEIRAYEAF